MNDLTRRYHHLGIPTDRPRPDETYLPQFKMHVAGFETSPFGIEWLRFEPGCPLPELVQRLPHLAFEVDDLEQALAGHEVLIEPNSPSPGVTVAFIVSDGAPVEFLHIEAPPADEPPGGDPFADFVERYDRFFGPAGDYDPAEVEFYRGLFEEHGARRVLDCACGTGRHLPLFAGLCPDVTGSDLSAAMLARADRNLAALGVRVPLVRTDYRRLPAHFERPFDAVACLSTSLAHMPDELEALRALRSMRAVLRPGGILVLTQGTTDRQWREKPRFILAADGPDVTRLFVIDYRGRGARYNIVDVRHDGEGGRLEAWGVNYARIYLRDDYERLLAEAGFRRIAFYGDYRRSPYDKETSGRLIAVAER